MTYKSKRICGNINKNFCRSSNHILSELRFQSRLEARRVNRQELSRVRLILSGFSSGRPIFWDHYTMLIGGRLLGYSFQKSKTTLLLFVYFFQKWGMRLRKFVSRSPPMKQRDQKSGGLQFWLPSPLPWYYLNEEEPQRFDELFCIWDEEDPFLRARESLRFLLLSMYELFFYMGFQKISISSTQTSTFVFFDFFFLDSFSMFLVFTNSYTGYSSQEDSPPLSESFFLPFLLLQFLLKSSISSTVSSNISFLSLVGTISSSLCIYTSNLLISEIQKAILCASVSTLSLLKFILFSYFFSATERILLSVCCLNSFTLRQWDYFLCIWTYELTFLSAFLRVEQKQFLMLLSVLPGSYLAICAHLFPNSSCTLNKICYSLSDQSLSLSMPGFS